MQQCPLCKLEARELGAVLLLSPDQLRGTSSRQPVTGSACVQCLMIVSMILDGLVGGGMRVLTDKLGLSVTRRA